MQLSIRDLTFAYPGGEPVFEHLNLNLDTGWRLGLIGRNGRGKTTLLRLMTGRMPFEGAIGLPLEAVYFPYEVPDASLPALEVLRLAAPARRSGRSCGNGSCWALGRRRWSVPFPHLAGANRPRHCSARCLRGRMPIP